MSVQNKKMLLQQLQEYSAMLNTQKSFEKSYIICLIIKLTDEILNEEMLVYKRDNPKLSSAQNCRIN